MDKIGINLCIRFAYPPNSLHLCGPEKQTDLVHYSTSGNTDKGSTEILTRFRTLYPYLRLIAEKNRIRDPFDRRVVEAYWIGNHLLKEIDIRSFALHLRETAGIQKHLKYPQYYKLMAKIEKGALPHHAFHVLNIYKRTGYDDSLHSADSMDACIINWGKVMSVGETSILVETQKIIGKDGILTKGKKTVRNILWQGENDSLALTVKPGDFISYHWGYVCTRLNNIQLDNLIFYTNQAMDLYNLHGGN